MLTPVLQNSHYSPDQKLGGRTINRGSLNTSVLDYDTNHIDMDMYVRNLKTSTVQLSEKVYVDKPMKRFKDVPIEN